MAFTDLLESILSAVYGKDVRQSIHDALEECHSIAEDANNATTEISKIATEAKTTAEEAKEVAEAAEDQVAENESDIDNLRTIIYLLLEPVSVQLQQNIGWRTSGPSRFVQETFSDGLHQGVKMSVEPGEDYMFISSERSDLGNIEVKKPRGAS